MTLSRSSSSIFALSMLLLAACTTPVVLANSTGGTSTSGTTTSSGTGAATTTSSGTGGVSGTGGATSSTSSGTGGDAATCVPLGACPSGPVCSLHYADAPIRIKIWVADNAAAGGGFAVDLPAGMPVNAGAHTYEWQYWLVGDGGEWCTGLFGDGGISVDGQANVFQFAFHGAPCVATSASSVECTLPLQRTNATCSGCASPATERRYALTWTGGASPSYLLTAEGPPEMCGAGIDLLEIELPASAPPQC
jgi:hypothetical protein